MKVKIFLLILLLGISFQSSYAKTYPKVASQEELDALKKDVKSLQDTTRELEIRVNAFSESIDLQSNAISWFSLIGSIVGGLFLLVSIFGFTSFVEIYKKNAEANSLKRDIKSLKDEVTEVLKKSETKLIESQEGMISSVGKVEQFLETGQARLKSIEGFQEYIDVIETDVSKFKTPSFLYFPTEQEKQAVYQVETKLDFLRTIGKEHEKSSLIKMLSSYYLHDWITAIKHFEDSDPNFLTNEQHFVFGLAKFKNDEYRDAKDIFDEIISNDEKFVIAYKLFAQSYLYYKGDITDESDQEWMENDVLALKRLYMLREQNVLDSSRLNKLLDKVSSNLDHKKLFERELKAMSILQEIEKFENSIQELELEIQQANDNLEKAKEKSRVRIADKESSLSEKEEGNESDIFKDEIAKVRDDIEELKISHEEELKKGSQSISELEFNIPILEAFHRDKMAQFRQEMIAVLRNTKNLKGIDYQAKIYQKYLDFTDPILLKEHGISYPNIKM